MKLKDLKKNFITKLAITYPNEEILSIFKILCKEYLNMSAAKLLLAGEELINKKQIDMFSKAIVRLLNEEPIQYILQTTTFYGLEFICTPSALIPRPETEELVDWIISDHENIPNKSQILDIGTGSGCIAICLAKHLVHKSVIGLDVSKDALALAKQNAALNRVAVAFREADILSYEGDTNTYDIIVSNPPYVRVQEKQEMKNNVLAHEPHLALFVEDNSPLVFYEKITKFAKIHLHEQGSLYFEINQYLGKETMAMIAAHGFTVELRQDLFGNDRMIKAKREL